jgi:flagellar protein FliL
MARDEEEAEEKPEGGKSKTLVIVIALVVSLACIGAGVAFYLKSSGGESAHPAKGKKSGGHAPSSEELPAIFAMEPFVVNIRDNSDVRYLKLKVEFEVVAEGKEVKAELDPYLPQLKDSILMLLTSKTMDEVKDVAGKSRLKQEIMSSACRILPRGKVTKVFFTDFVIQ